MKKRMCSSLLYDEITFGQKVVYDETTFVQKGLYDEKSYDKKEYMTYRLMTNSHMMKRLL